MVATMTDVIVVGAGVAGCQAAYELAADHDVTLIDRDGVAAGTTGLSAGLVAPSLFYGDIPPVARYVSEFFREFDEAGFTERDRLDFVPPDLRKEMVTEARDLADEGFPVSYLDADAVASSYPWFDTDEFEGAVEYRDTGWVDPYSYTKALADGAERNGAELITGVAVQAVLVDEDTVVGVSTDAGEIEADTVVLAPGWCARSLLPASVELPIRPYRTQAVVLEPDSPLPDAFPLGRLRTEHLYFRPEHNGDLLVGGAHYLIDDPEGASANPDESFKQDVAAYVPELIDTFDRAGFVNGWAGVDAATPDARPIIDDVGPDGLVVATGFNGLGVMVSPIVGPIVRQRVTGEKAPFPAAPFALERFKSLSSEFEYISTSDI